MIPPVTYPLVAMVSVVAVALHSIDLRQWGRVSGLTQILECSWIVVLTVSALVESAWVAVGLMLYGVVAFVLVGLMMVRDLTPVKAKGQSGG